MKRVNAELASVISQKSVKKSFSFILMLVMLFNVFAYPVIASGDVAYIYKSKAAVDKNIVGVFEDLGLSVELVNEKNIGDLSDYKIVYVGDERFRHEDDIKVWEYPTIVSNYYYGGEWGLTDSDGVSKLGSSAPLSVKIGTSIIQVYDRATFSGGVSIPYYFLSTENIGENFIKVASPFTNDGDVTGDVISYLNAGDKLVNGKTAEDNICFFGIVESKYWTDDAEELFKECVGFVGVSCDSDNDCNDESVGDPYCVGDDVYQNVNDFSCQNAGTVNSQCVANTQSVLVESCSNSCYDGACVCLDRDNDGYDECGVGDDGDDGKPMDCNESNSNINPGALEVCDGIDNDCDGQVDEGSNICGYGNVCSLGSCTVVECNIDADCGVDGFFDGRFCTNNDVYQNYVDYTCENPGTVSSSCTQQVTAKKVTDCSDSCSEGSCISIGCSSDSECNDNNQYTKDSCVYPGTVNSYCKNDPIQCITDNDCDDNDDYTVDSCKNAGTVNSYCKNEDVVCLSNADCGIDGFVDGLYCSNDDVHRDYRTFNCLNPGTINASCSQTVESRLVSECSDTCTDGSCVEITCNTDTDCEDGDSETTDVCLNPGTVNSQCKHEDILCSTDSQCGTDRYTGDLYCEGKSIYRNYISFSCNEASTQGSFCSNDVSGVEIYECQYACNEGNCIRCNTQVDCNDGNDGTVDICRFGGTIDSYCSHETVSCFEDADCGEDSFTGAPFCIGDDVYQNFRDLSCKNAGTSGSFCDADSEAQLIESCNYGCSNGACISDTECKNNVDDDNDGLIDAQDPGCWDNPADPNTYNPELDDESDYDVECFSANNCPQPSYISSPYCIDDDTLGNDYPVAVCNNPGTGISSCGIDTQVVSQDCNAGEICIVDQCVNDCVDNDNDGYDNCSEGEDDDGNPLDCNDNNYNVNPGATEICNGIDDNCDGIIDDLDDEQGVSLSFVSDSDDLVSKSSSLINTPVVVDDNYFSTSFDGAHWIRHPADNPAKVSETFWFERDFNIPGNVLGDLNGKLKVAADDGYIAYLNGVKVGENLNLNSYVNPTTHLFDESYLVPGKNVLTFKVSDYRLRSALKYSVSINGDSSNVCQPEIPETTSLVNLHIAQQTGEEAILEFLNGLGFSDYPTTYSARSDAVTASKICELKGYESYEIDSTGNPSSCHDNYNVYWDEASQDFLSESSCNGGSNNQIFRVVCSNPLE